MTDLTQRARDLALTLYSTSCDDAASEKDKKCIQLSGFNTAEEAFAAREVFGKKLHGPFWNPG